MHPHIDIPADGDTVFITRSIDPSMFGGSESVSSRSSGSFVAQRPNDPAPKVIAIA
jgi:hypothetical protein